MTKLSVNINKVATIRNARGGNIPNVLQVALDCERFGAQGITVHPRPDERHIRYADVRALKQVLSTEFNIELLKNVMSREKIYDVKSIDTVSGLSDADNYICGMSVLFMMLTGLGLGGLLCEKNESLLRVLKSRGLSYISSIICELITVTLLEMSSVSFGTGEETIPPKGIWAMSL